VVKIKENGDLSIIVIERHLNDLSFSLVKYLLIEFNGILRNNKLTRIASYNTTFDSSSVKHTLIVNLQYTDNDVHIY